MNGCALRIVVASQKLTKHLIGSLTTLLLLTLFSNNATAQSALVNGALYQGAIAISGQVDTLTFTANAGDSVVVRVGKLTGNTYFDPWLRLYGPDGTLLGSGDSLGETAEEIALTATNSGTYTVLVSDGGFNGYGQTGTYQLNYVAAPGSFVVSPGDQGGPMTNGALYAGTISSGDLDAWSFTANAGDSVVVRVGELTGVTYFDPWLRVYGPDGTLLGSGDPDGEAGEEITLTATNSGTYTVLVSDGGFNGYGQTGTYQLNYVAAPGSFAVSPGDQGGPMTNGALYAGTISSGDLDAWNFTANAGDSINLRLGTSGFSGSLELYGPNGVLLSTAENNTDELIAYTATNSGTFTVLVSSYYLNGTGTYVLNLAQIPEPYIVSAGDEGGPMTNGGNYAGTITLGDQDMWSFTANAGDSINLRVGATGFDGWLKLYGPNGALVATSGSGYVDAGIAYTATNSGTFTVLVSSYYLNGTGTYVLNLAQIPEPFIVPAGDEGGPLTNGADATGTITLGDQDMWSFTANAGDSINLRVGATRFDGWLKLYGPDGALLTTGGSGYVDALIAYTATNSGTFTVLVSSYYLNGTGTYVLHLAQAPESFIVPAGDEGGAMTGVTKYYGTITLGDLDMWSFTACQGDSINLQLNTTNFNGYLELYGSNGALLKTSGGSTVSRIAYTATNCGTFTVLVSSYSAGGTGTYGLSANGLADALKVCPPMISGASLKVNGVGGTANAVFVLYTTTNVATPFGLWTPVLTNQFDQFGVFSYTNIYNPAQRQQFFRFRVP